MKLLKIIPIILLFSISNLVQTQSYQYPSQERVEELLNEIEECKELLSKTKKEVSDMENSPNSYTLAQYKEAKAFIERLKTCINANRGELASIKKEYPGWFNAPNSVMPLRGGIEVSPHSLQDRLNDIEAKIKRVLAQFDALKEPN